MKNFHLEKDNTVFLFIDVQDKLINSVFNKEQFMKNTKVLSEVAGIMGVETLATLQYPKGLGEMNAEVKAPIENVNTIAKTAFSAMLDEEFIKAIKATGKKQIVVLGIEAHVCVMFTARDLIDAGFEVYIPSDAVGSRSEFNYNNALHQLNEMGCVITNTESVMFDLNSVAGTETFKKVQSLIK